MGMCENTSVVLSPVTERSPYMSELLEITMILCFGASWPMNVIKSYKSRTAKGKSLPFLLLITFGYIAGIFSKFSNSFVFACNVIYEKKLDIVFDGKYFFKFTGIYILIGLLPLFFR